MLEKTTPVRWPQQRHTLAVYLYELANPHFQRERWIEGKGAKPGVMDGFWLIINFFFDDTELAENPAGTVGYILLDELEVAAIRNLDKAMKDVLQEVGSKDSDQDYIAAPSWSKVVLTAQKAYRLIRSRMASAGNAVPPELNSPG